MSIVREKYLKLFIEFAQSMGEDARMVSGNAFMFPVVEEEENEDCFVVCTFTVPRGGNDGEAYDGYAVAEQYQEHVQELEEKARQREKEKEIAAQKRAEKIAARKAKKEEKEEKKG